MHMQSKTIVAERAMPCGATAPIASVLDHEVRLLQHLDSVRRDKQSALLLSLVRFIGAAYATGDAECWEAAHQCAEDAAGANDGPIFVARAASLVRTIRRCTARDFVYWPASCVRLSNDEASLMILIESACGADPFASRRAALDIVGEQHVAEVIRAASELVKTEMTCTHGSLRLPNLSSERFISPR
jgi:hypothetical protein